MLPQRASRGEIYAAQLPDRRYAACQVVAERQKHVELVGLHWIGDALPTLEQLQGTPPLEVYHHTHKPHVDRVAVDPAPPYWVVRVGSAAPIVAAEAPTKAFASWVSPFHDILRQWRWDHEVPSAEKAAYVRATRGDKVSLTLGGSEHVVDANTWRLWLGPGAPASPQTPTFALSVDPRVPIEWDELRKLGALEEIVYSGHDQGFAAYLRARKRIRRVVWRDHRQARIDLRGSGVRSLGLDGGQAPLQLAVDGLVDLYLYGPTTGLRVDDPRAGWGLRLHLQQPELPAAPIAGLADLRALSARKLVVAHVSRLAPYRGLQSASLTGAPGELRELELLRGLASLRRLALRDFYRGDFDAFPAVSDLPALDTLELHGLPAAALALLCGRAASLRCVRSGGSKSDAWVAQHDQPA